MGAVGIGFIALSKLLIQLCCRARRRFVLDAGRDFDGPGFRLHHLLFRSPEVRVRLTSGAGGALGGRSLVWGLHRTIVPGLRYRVSDLRQGGQERSRQETTVRCVRAPLWLEPTGEVAAAFEVEHTTSIYSGIVRMLDLALSGDSAAAHGMFLVAPDAREDDVRAQIRRPAFTPVADRRVR
jgi:hypothetical protein